MREYIDALCDYAIGAGLIDAEDKLFAYNALLGVLKLDAAERRGDADELPLAGILKKLTDDAVRRGVIGDSVTERDLFDTALMGVLTPFPHEVRQRFSELYAQNPEAATDWFYKFSGDLNYIRRDRTARDIRTKYNSEYGELDITINLSKPEKDPRAIAAAKNAAQTGYPSCQLCAENEGYAGRLDHPARQNHRVIPLSLCGESWYLQYSPYVYYNEHCIVLNREHIPMHVDRGCFAKLLDFVAQFPHYFVGSNADLPIVGGSILSHDHFQGGRYEFAMAKAEREIYFSVPGFEDVEAATVKWPMSVIRLASEDKERLCLLADRILSSWRGYSDPDAFIFAETDGVPHNTVTPIARRRGERYELDLVLRNNITTPEHPLGVFHPHAQLHHIKKENIGLIEVMGLAVLPSRLKTELAALKDCILTGRELSSDEKTAKHAPWARSFLCKYSFTPENTDEILMREVGAVFEQVLCDAGVFKRDEKGKAAFMRFIAQI